MAIEKRLRRSQAAALLPDDVLFNILMRVPPKSLLRLMCVCKNWDSIIRSQPFILNYSSSRPQRFLIHFNHKSSFTMLSHSPSTLLPHPQIPSGVVTSVCKGILCITTTQPLRHKIYLWNPTIAKLRVLTTSCLFSPQTYKRWYLKFPYTSIGLGFDSNTNDYKILRIGFDDVTDTPHLKKKTRLPQAELYSLSLDSWRRVKLPYRTKDKFLQGFLKRSAFVNGAFHFLVGFSSQEKRRYLSILRFDLVQERFEEIELPKDFYKGLNYPLPHLTTFKGLLSVFLLDSPKRAEDVVMPCCIWTMNQGFWSKQTVESVELPRAGERWDFVGDHLVLLKKDRVCLVNPQSLQRQVFEITSPHSAHVYTESLALL